MPSRELHWPSLGLNLPVCRGLDGRRDAALAGHPGDGAGGGGRGFDAVWVSDHVGFGDPDGEWSGAWESWTLLSALADATTRVRLGTYVLAMPYRNPALLAKMAETLDEVCGGRVMLGLGAGWNEPEFAAYGFPWERRFDRFEDGLRIVVRMLRRAARRRRPAGAGDRGAAPAARAATRGLPVMVGAGGPRMLRLAAELADEWNAGMRTPGGARPDGRGARRGMRRRRS